MAIGGGKGRGRAGGGKGKGGERGSGRGAERGAETHRRRRALVAAAGARQKHQLQAIQLAEQKRIRCLAKGGGHPLPTRVFQPVDIVDAAAADDADDRPTT